VVIPALHAERAPECGGAHQVRTRTSTPRPAPIPDHEPVGHEVDEHRHRIRHPGRSASTATETGDRHGGELQQAARRRIQGIDPGGDQRLQRVRQLGSEPGREHGAVPVDHHLRVVARYFSISSR